MRSSIARSRAVASAATPSLVNAEGISTFVKLHWKPCLGVQSLIWDESAKLQGADNDFLHRDLWRKPDNFEQVALLPSNLGPGPTSALRNNGTDCPGERSSCVG